jgi:hypothetical protein
MKSRHVLYVIVKAAAGQRGACPAARSFSAMLKKGKPSRDVSVTQ